jgi:phosphoenolpyruvate synthase/pyruvate phosphate dikinase
MAKKYKYARFFQDIRMEDVSLVGGKTASLGEMYRELTLGVDRDSEIVAFDYDERDAGVKEMIRMSVESCKRNGRHSGLCGQAPSDYPEMAEFLVEIGIDSMSLNPDSVLKTTLHVLDVEKQLGRKPRTQQAEKRRQK